MKAVRSTPPGVTVVDVDPPEGGDLVRIRSAGICASDFKYIAWGSSMVLGHELAGVTDDGTPVAIEALFGCDGCERCDAGNYNLCVRGPTALGVVTDGGMSEYFAAPSRSLVPLPMGLDPADACLLEPASVAWHACRLAGVGPDLRVAVVGGSAIGFLMVAAAESMGAAETSLESRYTHQREVGERLGATSVSGGYDIVLDAAGSGTALHRAVDLARPGGTMVVLGFYDPDVVWPQHELFLKELRTVPSLGYCRHNGRRDFDNVAEMLAQNPDIANSLITHRFPIDDAAEAFRVASDKSTGALRVVLQP
jgi:2-desacetyl-2-hydroxyethyl bacteriochlorophyllide A dehydrogenase